MEGFNRFLARCETMDAVDNEMRGQFGSQRGISQREMQRLKGQSARWAPIEGCGRLCWVCAAQPAANAAQPASSIAELLGVLLHACMSAAVGHRL